MRYPRLTVQKKKSDTKSRELSSRLLGYITADRLWDVPVSGDAERPAWLAVFGTEGEAQPFVANLRAGRTVVGPRLKLALPKSVKYRWWSQRVPGGVVTGAYQPELFHLEPLRYDADPVQFLVAPSKSWVERQRERLEGTFGKEASEAARAAHFAAYLDRRTALPVIRDLRFYLQLYRAAREAGILGKSAYVSGTDLSACGLEAPEAFRAWQPQVAQLLQAETGKWRLAGRPVAEVLEEPVAEPSFQVAAEQLAFDFAA